MNNPFFYGRSVEPSRFLGREDELRRINDCINSGRSAVIIGEYRAGKTSLLKYIELKKQSELSQNTINEKRFFSFVDISSVSKNENQSCFWKRAIEPIYSKTIQINPESKLGKLYKDCLENNFNFNSLELFFNELEIQGYHLVLLLDEFSTLFERPSLSTDEFLIPLRYLSSNKRSLSLIAASPKSIAYLNENIQRVNNSDLNFFSNFVQCLLSPFSEEDINLLLSRANGRFSEEDTHFIKHIAGHHPYLLQAAASELWDVYEDGENDVNKIKRKTWFSLYSIGSENVFKPAWKMWSPQMRKAITIILLADKTELGSRLFNPNDLVTDLQFLLKELAFLQTWGYIKKIDNNWKIIPAIFERWLIDELINTVESNQDINQWLHDKEAVMFGLCTNEQKNQIIKGVKFLSNWIKPDALIDLFIKK